MKLTVEGAAAEHVLAFARISGAQAVITIVPRMCLGLLEGQGTPFVPVERWRDTRVKLPQNLSGQSWLDVTTGETHAAQGSLSVGEVLRRFPVAVLASEGLQ